MLNLEVSYIRYLDRSDSEKVRLYQLRCANASAFGLRGYVDSLSPLVAMHHYDLACAQPTSKHVWDVKVPLKIKVFMWFVHKQVILTKDNLIKRNWTGPTRCSFCDRDETIKPLSWLPVCQSPLADGPQCFEYYSTEFCQRII